MLKLIEIISITITVIFIKYIYLFIFIILLTYSNKLFMITSYLKSDIIAEKSNHIILNRKQRDIKDIWLKNVTKRNSIFIWIFEVKERKKKNGKRGSILFSFSFLSFEIVLKYLKV